jgi:hypothetical protein
MYHRVREQALLAGHTWYVLPSKLLIWVASVTLSFRDSSAAFRLEPRLTGTGKGGALRRPCTSFIDDGCNMMGVCRTVVVGAGGQGGAEMKSSATLLATDPQ